MSERPLAIFPEPVDWLFVGDILARLRDTHVVTRFEPVTDATYGTCQVLYVTHAEAGPGQEAVA